MRKEKDTWLEEQCRGIEENNVMQKNNSKKTCQLGKELTSSEQGRTTTIKNFYKAGTCLTEDQDILEMDRVLL